MLQNEMAYVHLFGRGGGGKRLQKQGHDMFLEKVWYIAGARERFC